MSKKIMLICLLTFTNFTSSQSQEIDTFVDLAQSCLKYNEMSNTKNTRKIFSRADWHSFASCKSFLTAYTAVATHNCQFGAFSNNLHKLNTRNISVAQMAVAIQLYNDRNIKKINSDILDNVWKALASHWPCNEN